MPELEEVEKAPPVVRAVRLLGWRCPSCNAMNICDKSSTSTSACYRCDNIYTVDVKRGVR